MPCPRHKPHTSPRGERDRQHVEQDLGGIAATGKQCRGKQRTGERAHSARSHGGSEPGAARFVSIQNTTSSVHDDLLGREWRRQGVAR